MKSAEEWAGLISTHPYFKDANTPEVCEMLSPFIKQIQLDAWKQGMTDAASLMKARASVYCGAHLNAIDLFIDAKQTILAARDNKTSL